jgi:hypothetical protein
VMPVQKTCGCRPEETCGCRPEERFPNPPPFGLLGGYPSTAIVVCCSPTNNSRSCANCNENKSLACSDYDEDGCALSPPPLRSSNFVVKTPSAWPNKLLFDK